MNALLQGRYEIIQTLSAGGFGETYVAIDRQLPSQRKVVIKKFKPQQPLDAHTYELVRERFEREAAVLESLSDVCRHVPKLYAFFSEAGDYFLVQEFIEGQTLTAFVRTQGRLDEAATRQLLTSLLEALHEIHAQGIIHRDIKPDNILLRAGTGQPVLIDFGAVKEIITTVLDAYGTPLHSSLILGTPGYTPAEQSVGRPVYASDLYSLAMTMIFALTGRQPHELNDLASGELRWRQHTGKLSQPLTDSLERATQYDYRERFKNALEMLDAVNVAPIPQPEPVKPLVQPEPVLPIVTVDPTTMPGPTPPKPKPKPRIEPQPKPRIYRIGPPPVRKAVGLPVLLKVFIGLCLTAILGGGIYWVNNKSIETTTKQAGRTAVVQSGKEFTETINGVKLAMIGIPAGSFLMGSSSNDAHNDEKPQHRVNVKAFAMGKYEITQMQWQAVMGNNPSIFKGDNLPVEQVSWNDAKCFCQKLSQLTGKAYRLPTEAEWEYACRAGRTGNAADDNATDGIGTYTTTTWLARPTKPIGQKLANTFGLFDMNGNVSEWCDDVWHDNYNEAPVDGSAWLSGTDSSKRVVRGAISVLEGFHVANRSWRAQDSRSFAVNARGFRVVVSASIP